MMDIAPDAVPHDRAGGVDSRLHGIRPRLSRRKEGAVVGCDPVVDRVGYPLRRRRGRCRRFPRCKRVRSQRVRQLRGHDPHQRMAGLRVERRVVGPGVHRAVPVGQERAPRLGCNRLGIGVDRRHVGDIEVSAIAQARPDSLGPVRRMDVMAEVVRVVACGDALIGSDDGTDRGVAFAGE